MDNLDNNITIGEFIAMYMAEWAEANKAHERIAEIDKEIASLQDERRKVEASAHPRFIDMKCMNLLNREIEKGVKALKDAKRQGDGGDHG